MSKRFTDTTKWTDKWFRKLSVYEKLLFLWLVDNCDNAGFWEVDLELAAQQIGISEAEATGAWEGLCRAYSTQGEYVWVKRFIRVQGNCPLNPDNNAHKQILSLFQEHADFGVDFESALRSEQKNSPSLGPKEAPCNSKGKSNGHSKGNGKGKRARKQKTFVPPTQEEVTIYITENPELSNVDPVNFYKSFNDGGWIDTQGKPVRNWKLKIRTWSNYGQSGKSQRTHTPAASGEQGRPSGGSAVGFIR